MRSCKILMFSTVFSKIALALSIIGLSSEFLVMCSVYKLNKVCPDQLSRYVAMIFLSLGIALFITNSVMFFAIYKNNSIILRDTNTVVIVFIFLELAVCIWGLVVGLSEGTHEFVQEELFSLFAGNYLNVKNVQQAFSCCGLDNPKFWGEHIPKSCFPHSNRKNKMFREGCSVPVYSYLKMFPVSLSGMFAAIMASQVIGVLAAKSIIKDIEGDDE